MLHASTLYDLDIFSPAHKNKACLWDKLNYCRTEGGQERLKKILLLEHHSPEHTLNRQAAIAYLSSKAGRVHFPVTESEVFYLERYLASNYTIDETKTKLMLAVKSYTKLIAAKSDYLYILSGVKQATGIINHIRDVYEQLAGGSAPKLLKGIFSRIENCLGQLPRKNDAVIINGEPHPAMLFTTDRQLRLNNKNALKELLDCYYELEAMFSLARAHNDMKLSFPETSNRFYVKGMYHPLVPGCKANDVILNGEYMLLVTGPNMAGKSTFLKSIGLTFLLAYIGVGVPAESAQIPFLNHIVTGVNTEDDIGNGYSYFFNEVQHVKSIARGLNEEASTLVIVDELFKGTNVKDANDCTETVMNGFLKYPGSLFVVATHLTETVELFNNKKECRLLCFDGTIAEKNVHFDYLLKQGISNTRLGKYIMQQEQIPELFGL